jgi:methylated-DNA-[protein]-cysteine S-methyltransferase
MRADSHVHVDPERLGGVTTTTAWDIHETPLGPLTLQAEAGGLTALWFPGRPGTLAEDGRNPARLAGAARQLDEYFAARRTVFDLELDLAGTPFQRRVWAALREIPYGGTVTYTELAREVGRPDIVRAVAAAVGSTPVPIVVPCHRVVGADGSLTGYGGGLERKRALLDLEQRGAACLETLPPGASRQLALL